MSARPDDIDAGGDALLVLENPRSSWRLGGNRQFWNDLLPKHRSRESKVSEDHLESALINAELDTLNEMPHKPTKQSEDFERAGSRPEGEEAQMTQEQSRQLKPSANASDVRMRLSSKHLTLASEYFRGASAHGYAETKAGAEYTYVFMARGWDKDALRIVMNIIHSQTRSVPRKVSLDMLAKIAVVVDYYKCHNAVDFFSQTWIQDHGTSFPHYSKGLLLRLFVACVFSEQNVFKKLTKTLILDCRGPIHDLDLPPLAHIAGTLK